MYNIVNIFEYKIKTLDKLMNKVIYDLFTSFV